MLTKGGFYRGGPVLSSAVAGIDQALWDIAGKALRRAGARAARRARCATGSGCTPGSAATSRPSSREAVAAQVEAGFTAVKMNACGRTARRSPPPAETAGDRRARGGRPRGARARTATSPIDFHGRVVAGRRAARSCPLLEPLQPLFVEEPVLPEHGRTCCATLVASDVRAGRHRRAAVLARRLPAACSRRASRSSSRTCRTPAASPRSAGSPRSPRPTTRCSRRTARSARSRWRPACRSPSPRPNFLIQEQSLGIHYNARRRPARLPRRPDAVHASSTATSRRPTAPGLGVDGRRGTRCARADRPAHAWRNPVWRHDDGSFAEW